MSLIVPVFIAVITVLSYLTFQYEKSWNSQFALYMNALKVGSLGYNTKESIHANVYLGEYYYNNGDIDSAIPYLHKAVLMNINYSDTGNVLLSKSVFYELSDYSKLILEDALIEDVINSYNILATYYCDKKDYYNALLIINRGLSFNRNNKYLLELKRLLKDRFLD
jgi:tetratricopeptide (TPR) repeat protein